VEVEAIQEQRNNPERINRFLNSEGRLSVLPAKKGKRLAVLAYLALKFELERDYTEKEVNALCDAWHTFGDYFIVRRELIEAGFLHRVPDGSRYWRESPAEQLSALFVLDMAGYQAVLRKEKKADWKVVEQVTYWAFRDAPPTGADDDGNEALLAHKLRSCAAFVPELDYVAELNGSIIGNIMYTKSKVVSDSEGSVTREWDTLTFGPVSVLPKYQRQGVGSALIRKTLEAARELGYRAVLIFGHESYYPRFGFKPASEFGITTADGKDFPAFMALPLYDGALDGVCGRLICDEVYVTLDRVESDKLNAKLAEPMDVDEYIDTQPVMIQQLLRNIRGAIRTAAPDAVEKISYQMPTYWQGKNLIHFAAQKRHLGIYPGAEAMEHFMPRLAKYKTSKGAIQFPYKDFGNEQLSLIAEIAAWCFDNAYGGE
jgi:predicted N-acetyltransferase YhbS/uncharacterized protein YdhG (YjbR/CyaY superfamily)